jgi:hypothetical protein
MSNAGQTVNTGWSDDFSYDYFTRLLETAQAKFNLRLLGDGLATDSERPQLFLRHDVDVAVAPALSMAALEAERGVRATYMFIPNSPLYDVRREQKLLRQFICLNHEVALHFDPNECNRMSSARLADLLPQIERDCRIVADVTGKPVRSVSFHRPAPQFLDGELTVSGRINAYAAALMRSYISDSKGEWRNGEPIAYLRACVSPVVQVLVHPIWWGARHMKSRERLQHFYFDATAKGTPAERRRFDAGLTRALPSVRRLGCAER